MHDSRCWRTRGLDCSYPEATIQLWCLSLQHRSSDHDWCWTGIVFFWYHLGIYNEDFTYFDTSRLWVFDGILFPKPLGSIYQEPSHLPKMALVSIWFRTVLAQIRTLGIWRFSHPEIPAKYRYSIGVTILRPMGRFFDTIIGVDYWFHTFTHIPVQHWSWPLFNPSKSWDFQLFVQGQVGNPIYSPIPESLYPILAVLLLTIGLIFTASFFM